MNLSLKPIYQVPVELVAETLNQAFTDYIGGELHLDTPGAHQFLHIENIHPILSKIVFDDGDPAGVALISRMGWNSRLAGMGIVPEKTQKGIGTWLMKELLDEAYQRGDRSYTLEVIEQNEPAVRLYENNGFRIVRRLYGYTAVPAHEADRDKDLIEKDLLEISRVLSANEPADMPWQISGEAIARLGPPHMGFQLGPAYAAISPTKKNTVVLRSMVVEEELRNLGHASRLIRALFALYPEHNWKIPINFPEPPKGQNLFTRLGFKKEAINQFQMVYWLQ